MLKGCKYHAIFKEWDGEESKILAEINADDTVRLYYPEVKESTYLNTYGEVRSAKWINYVYHVVSNRYFLANVKEVPTEVWYGDPIEYSV